MLNIRINLLHLSALLCMPHMKKNLLLLTVFLTFISHISATTYYVDARKSTNSGNGTSWPTAKKDLQVAINLTLAGDSVLVAEGIYHPTEAINGSNTDPRDKSFFLNKDITLIGGYPSGGLNSGATSGPTILSGDIGIIGNTSDNSYHVFVTAGLTRAALIKGLVIVDGRADGSSTVYFSGKDFFRSSGGGMYNRKSSPTINSVVIANNYASQAGGLYNYEANVSLRNSVICYNSANSSGGIRNTASTAIFVNITVAFNSANDGPGIVVPQDTLEISNSVVYGNSASTGCSNDICIGSSTILSNSKKNASNILNGTLSGLAGFQYLNSNPFVGAATGPDGQYMTVDDGFRPKFGSNLINNAGALLAQPDTVDITGLPRTNGGFVDIGAYEYNCTNYGGLAHKSCNTSFMAPSGKIITASGIFTDTLTNAQNCDSLIRLDIKVNPRVIYVDASRPDNSADGYSWANAKKDFQDGLDLALTDSGCDTVKVAEGVYYPTVSVEGDTSKTSFLSFHIDKEMVVLGGYPSGGGLRDFRTKHSILSGDIGIPGDKSDNCYHVLITANLTPVSLISGFIIEGGNANNITYQLYSGQFFYAARGGGIHNVASSPVLANTIFRNNTAAFGGGIYNLYSNSKITNVVFENNKGTGSGGGMRNSESNISLYNVAFYKNQAGSQGGGGLSNTFNSNTKLINVSFVDNQSTFNGSGIDNENSATVALFNNVFYGNGANSFLNRTGGSTSAISRNNASDVITGLSGLTNTITLTSSPFLNITAPSGGDSLWMTPDDGLRPAKGSPLADAGTIALPGNLPPRDLSGLNRIYNDSVDIGPYELLCESYSGQKITECHSFTTYASQVLTASGIYHDTLTNRNNCDSIITYHLTINSAPAYYVDASRPDNSGDGASWATAKKDLQDAISLARASNGCNIIHMAEGIYYPTVSLDSLSTDARNNTFIISKDLSISGGYPQGGGAQNPQKHNTILSGDRGVPNYDVDNCYHVLFLYGLSSISKLENLIIQDGKANGWTQFKYHDRYIYQNRGAAMWLLGSSPYLSNLVVTDNFSQQEGSVYIDDSAPVFTNALFSHNLGNWTIYKSSSQVSVINSTFYKNTKASTNDITYKNCVFYKNGSDVSGNPKATSSNNSSDIITGSFLPQSANFVQLLSNPFLDTANPKGADGIWMSTDDGLQPKYNSPLIDMGANINLPQLDLSGGIRVFNGIPDLGAYELNCSNGVLWLNGNLSANTPNANYQWVDCNANFSAIAGATNQSFTPSANGSYAVIINNGTCADTSTCFLVNNVSLTESGFYEYIHIYPNPTSGKIKMLIPFHINGYIEIDIYNSLGQSVANYHKETANEIEVNIPETSGVYTLKITLGGETIVRRVIRN